MSEPIASSAQRQNHAKRIALLSLGLGLIGVSPLVGIVPGPGGLVVFAAGLALVLRTSLSAKRRYVRAKRRWPKFGGWADWGLRRASARRRAALAEHSPGPIDFTGALPYRPRPSAAARVERGGPFCSDVGFRQ